MGIGIYEFMGMGAGIDTRHGRGHGQGMGMCTGHGQSVIGHGHGQWYGYGLGNGNGHGHRHGNVEENASLGQTLQGGVRNMVHQLDGVSAGRYREFYRGVTKEMENISRGPTWVLPSWILSLSAQRGRCRTSRLQDY
jgi:hypothetical protein